MQPGVDPHVQVYAPLDTDLVDHLARIASFNDRALRPTSWQLEVHAGDDWPERFLRERPGNVAILSGRNRSKIDLIRMAVEAGMHVLADKPWIIEPEDMPKLTATMQKASQARLLLFDMMTERFEPASILQREIVADENLFGAIEMGDVDNPGVFMESTHYLKKAVAGAPLRRPASFFDVAQQGESLTDVGVHLVDLAMWMLFTGKPIDYRKDVQLLDARRWPTIIDCGLFQSITGQADFPPELQGWLSGGNLEFFCNNQVVYTLRGVHVRLDVLWEPESPYGGSDAHNAVFRGSRCSAIVRQAGGRPPELFIIPNADFKQQVRDALSVRVEAWQDKYPGTRLVGVGDEFHILIPNAYRAGHEAHFAEVMHQFLAYLEAPDTFPAWENPHLLAKYFTTTQGVALARRDGV
jgi:predicted dehydrogenase